MEAIEAIGLASGIISFIDFSWSLITGAKKLHASGRGTTKENARISNIIKDLKNFTLELEPAQSGGSKHERAIAALANECRELAEELIEILKKLKAKKDSRWESLQVMWASMRQSDNIAEIKSRLGECRAEINTRLLALINEQQSGLNSQLDSIQNEAERLSLSSAAEMKSLRADIAALLQNLEDDSDSGSDAGSDSSSCNNLHQKPFQSLDEVSSQLMRLQGLVQSTPRETRILEHLYFEGMFTRADSILDASERTFEWMLMPESEFEAYLAPLDISSDEDSSTYWTSDSEDDIPNARPNKSGRKHKQHVKFSKSQKERMNNARRLLQDWLFHGSGVFHISGKAGSGKSTLLKLLINHKRTTEALATWAGKRTLVSSSFYFWKSDGQKLQMGLDGMYRSILFSVLRQCPYLIPEVLEHQWKGMNTQSPNPVLEADLFRAPKIAEAFSNLVGLSSRSTNLRFCFFIDGLDEYNAHSHDQRVFARRLRDWAKSENVKICVTSRPEVQFMDTFMNTRIHLHELTDCDIYMSDIYRSAMDAFEQDESFPRLSKFYLEFVNDIVRSAEGVFLWARLVVQILLAEAALHSSYERLRQKLHSTPAQLDELYASIFSSLPRDDRKKLDFLFLMVASNPFEEPLNATLYDYIDSSGHLDTSSKHPHYNLAT
ncbi:hypothetical protein CSOJ01_15221 [Colletotrichum sojae]|uniref:Nephrocystin 3-like N-terminal domain-containing protein n=1 Tax=Colletotrichum sojae TaxID=2175907 RepID=A0A8H6IMV9_9PEZI|nr:hypothetical protein CSOJ01_15221 [Colletotrichum sojae]